MKKPGDRPRRRANGPPAGSAPSPTDDWLEFLADQLALELLDAAAAHGEEEDHDGGGTTQ